MSVVVFAATLRAPCGSRATAPAEIEPRKGLELALGLDIGSCLSDRRGEGWKWTTNDREEGCCPPARPALRGSGCLGGVNPIITHDTVGGVVYNVPG